MGRKPTGKLSSFEQPIHQELIRLRKLYSDWGPKTLLVELQDNPRFSKKELPSIRSIARFLNEQGLSRGYRTHSDLPTVPLFKPNFSHELWQVDGQGNTSVNEVGCIAMLNIKDVFSKTYVATWPAKMKSMQGHPNTSDYQTVLRLGFMEFGMPKHLQTDHASVFYDNNSKSPFPTILHLWLVGLGIKLVFSRVHRPTDQGVVERSHQTLEKQVLKRTIDFNNWEELYSFCQKRREKLNNRIPSSSTNNQSPLVEHPEAKHSGTFYQVNQEDNLIQLNRVYEYLSKQTWFRKIANNKTVSLGNQTYYIAGAKPKEQVKITFCKENMKLTFYNEQQTVQLPIKGITKEILMGNLKKLPSHQLLIPFDIETQKINKLFEP